MARRINTSVSLLGAACTVWACASGGGAAGGGATDGGGRSASTAFSYGYMIPGAGLAGALGVPATDTMPELTTRATVPATVVNAISQEVAAGKWNNQCTRRFGGPRTYAVIFHRACDSSLGPDADPMVVVGFSSDGRTIGRVQWAGPTTVTLLFPARRF
jgi:hypothetical protein